MTLERAIENNPYNPYMGNISAYIRYLRYNVDGWYNKTSKEVREILITEGGCLNDSRADQRSS